MDSAALTPVPEVQDAPDRSLYVLGPAHSPGEAPFAVPDADGVVTITPRRSTMVLLSAASGTPVFLFLVTQSFLQKNPAFWIFPAVVLVLVASLAWAAAVRASVVVTVDRVGWRTLFRYRWFDRASLSRLLIARGYGRGTDAFLSDSAGKMVMRLSGQIWDEPRIRAFHEALALPTRVRQGPTRRRDLEAEEPGALKWAEAHPVAMTVITIALALGITFVMFLGVIAILLGMITSH